MLVRQERERERRRCGVHLWRLLFRGLMVTTQMPEPLGQSLPTRQCGWGRWGRSLVTRETVTVTLVRCSTGPWIWGEGREDQ